MLVTIESSPAELSEKGEALVKAIQAELAPFRPDLAEALEKAVKERVEMAPSPYPALREIEEETNRRYLDQIERMVADIMTVLTETQLSKSEQDAKDHVIRRLVHEGGGTAEALERLSIPELLQKAAEL